jgi:hypothetical protein
VIRLAASSYFHWFMRSYLRATSRYIRPRSRICSWNSETRNLSDLPLSAFLSCLKQERRDYKKMNKWLKTLFVAIACVLALPAVALAQFPSPTYGWNLGNTLEPPCGEGC